jgi:Fe2+ transport system protein FeoA
MPVLSDQPNGSRVRVVSVAGAPLLRERLVELGFTVGTLVLVRGRAPLGDPIEVKVRGGILAVRRDEAACVEVAAEGGTPR